MSQELVSVRNLTENAKVGGNDDSSDDEIVKRSTLFKKPNVPTRYFTSLRSGKR